MGIAYGNLETKLALPLTTLERLPWERFCQNLDRLCKEYAVEGFILGLPKTLRGDEGRGCQSVRDTATNVLAWRDFPLCFSDERLSTRGVHAQQMEIGDFANRGRKRNDRKILDNDDAHAAAFMLQGFLDTLSVHSGVPLP